MPAALFLAAIGARVLMHGIAGHGQGYAPTRSALAALGVTPCRSLDEAVARLEAEVPAAAVTATAALALKVSGRAASIAEAEAMAAEMWRARPKAKYGGS